MTTDQIRNECQQIATRFNLTPGEAHAAIRAGKTNGKMPYPYAGENMKAAIASFR